MVIEPPWPEVLARLSTTQIIVDQCAMGLRTREGYLAKKPTVLVGNSEQLLKPPETRRCLGDRDLGRFVVGRAAAAQVWPWDFANRMVQGITKLKNHEENAWLQVMCP